MSGWSPDINTRGRYKCPYCAHTTWKQYGAAERHIMTVHYVEAAKVVEDQLRADNRKLLEDLQRCRQAPPAKPPAEKREYYQCVLYCKNENRVLKAGMPKGVLVENVTCSGCGVRGALVITNNDPSWPI